MVVESKVYIPSWAHGPLVRWITALPSSRIDQPAALAELPISYATERTDRQRLILSDLIRSDRTAAFAATALREGSAGAGWG